MKIFRMLKRFKNLESIESAIANAQTELNKTLTQSASVKDEYERKSNELNSTFIAEKNRLDQIIRDKNSTIVDLDKIINQSERAINTIEMMDEYGVPDYEDSLDELISSNRKSRKFFHGARTAVTDFGTLIVPLLLMARHVMVVSCRKIKRRVMRMPLTPIWTRKKNLVPTHLLPKSSRKSGTNLIYTRSVLIKSALFLTVNTYQHAS